MKLPLLFVAFVCCLPGRAQDWLWSKRVGGEGLEFGSIAHVDVAGNAFTYGEYAVSYGPDDFNNAYYDTDTLFGRNDSFIAKYDASGELVWIRNCTSSAGSLIILDMVCDTLNEFLFVTGYYEQSMSLDTCSLTTSSRAAFLAKLNLDGHCLWVVNVTNSGGIDGRALTVDDDGNAYLAGVGGPWSTFDVGGVTLPAGSFLAKFSSDGEQVWAKSIMAYTGSLRHLWVGSLAYGNGALFGLGSVANSTPNDSVTVDTIVARNINGGGHVLLRFDANNGTAEWMRFALCSSSGDLGENQMDLDQAGNVYYAGYFMDSTYVIGDTLLAPEVTSGPWTGVFKYSPEGDRLFVRQFGSDQFVIVRGIDVATDGSLLMTGSVGGDAMFGSFPFTTDTYSDMFVSAHDTLGECVGVVHAGRGEGIAVKGHESGVYVSAIFPSDTSAGSIALDQTYETYGYNDIVLAKHDKIAGIGEFRSAENDALVIYANPNQGSFRVKIPDAFLHERDLILSVFDNSGRMVRMQSLNMQDEHPRMDVFDVGKGLYTVTLTKGNRSYSGTMVVE